MKGNSYIPFMVRRGDGSTLSLDFTSMSALDSRFTFSRTSQGTFTNSQGLLRYADHNLFTNTAWLGSSLPTNWLLLIGTGTTTWNADGSVTMSAATSQRPAIYQTGITVSPGIAYTYGFVATNVSGSPTVADIVNSSIVGETYAVNGITVAGSTVVQNNDVVSCTFTPTSTSASPRIGPGCRNNVSNMSVTVSRPQMNIGTALAAYVLNTALTSYYGPRFDYDPSTLSAKGLLIEGSTTNRVLYSQTFATTGAGTPHWTEQHITRNSTNNTDPAGGSTALRITTSNPTGTLLNNVNLASAQRTFSIYLRRVSGTGNVELTLDGGTTWTAQSITSSWARYSITATSTANVGVRIVENGDSIELWGAQVEDGAAASSYIQTGTSTVQRANDVCSLTGSNFSSWYGTPTAFTVVFEGTVVSAGNYARILNFSSGANTNGTFPDFNIGVPSAASNRPFANSYIASNNNVDIYVPLAGAVTNGVAFKLAARCQAALHRITRGTGLAATSNYNGFPAGLANLYFGGSNGVYNVSAHYARVKFFPSAIPDAQMDTLAT